MKNKTTPAHGASAHNTNAAGFTPGPWTTDTDGDGKPFAIITSTHDKDGPDDDVCEVYGGNADDDATREANARLIASAPELLEALDKAAQQAQAIVDNHDYLKRRGNELQILAIAIREICDAAIARATGGQV